MPSHDAWFNPITLKQIASIQPKTVLDVGVGNGYWGKLIKQQFHDCYLIGVEIFPSYITEGLRKIYDDIVIGDIRKYCFSEGDLVIFGDVLEHMEKEEAMKVVKSASEKYEYMIINTPYGFAAQHEYCGNKYEIHICGLYPEDFKDYNILESNIRQEGVPLLNLLIKSVT